jgi:hypothetical protein
VYAKLYSLQMFEARDSAQSPSPDRQPSVS